jgi:hypothetical protein
MVNNLYGNTVDDSRDELQGTIDGGRTWSSTSPSSSLGVDTSIYAPSSPQNQNRNELVYPHQLAIYEEPLTCYS